jgi:RNA polymerase sigma-70 factor (ECF subfamily)
VGTFLEGSVSKGTRIGPEVTVASGEIVLHSAETLVAEAPEAGLVERCRQGDARAFAQLVSMHERMVYSLAARLLGDCEEAKDLSQEVFLQVYRTIGRFEGRSSVKTWIYRIVVNQCHNRRRWWMRRKRDQARAIEDLTARDEAQLAASQSQSEKDPFGDLERRERARRVQDALAAISFDQRAILVLREVEGLSCEEIGQALSLPVGTVKSRLARGREALRQRLVDRGSSQGGGR